MDYRICRARARLGQLSIGSVEGSGTGKDATKGATGSGASTGGSVSISQSQSGINRSQSLTIDGKNIETKGN